MPEAGRQFSRTFSAKDDYISPAGVNRPGYHDQNQYFFTNSATLGMARTLDSHDVPPEHLRSSAVDEHGNPTLFRSRPATAWEVGSLGATEHGSPDVPNLLGLAAVHSLKTSGKMPEASADLSFWSGRVVDKLVSKGVIQNPSERHIYGDNNGYTLTDGKRMVENVFTAFPHGVRQEVPEQDVAHAHALVRNALRKPKPKVSPQFEQAGLF